MRPRHGLQLQLQLVVDGLQLLVDRLQLLLAGLQLLGGRAVFLVDRLKLLVGGAQLLVGGLRFLARGAQAVERELQLLPQLADRLAGGRRVGTVDLALDDAVLERLALDEEDQRVARRIVVHLRRA